MIQTYLLMDFCCQIANFIWGQYVLNILRKRINVVSKTDQLINFVCSKEGINSASPRSGIGVYIFQWENV